jgi:hypothetical protein
MILKASSQTKELNPQSSLQGLGGRSVEVLLVPHTFSISPFCAIIMMGAT